VKNKVLLGIWLVSVLSFTLSPKTTCGNPGGAGCHMASGYTVKRMMPMCCTASLDGSFC
jgi:hypothetical protein